MLNDPRTCTAQCASMVSIVASGSEAHTMLPALFTTMSMPPKCSTAVSMTDLPPSTVDTSA